jgi:hypothetical protein
MPLYALITAEPLTDAAALERLKSFENKRQFAPNVWVIAVKNGQTTKDISEAILPRATTAGTGDLDLKPIRHAVFRIDSWWGFHDRSLWEWLDSAKKADGQ